MPAIRGIIYDTNRDDILAFNRRSFAVTMVPQNLPKDAEAREKLLNSLAVLLEISKKEILAIIKEKNYSK